ncbi:MAG: SRPBCC family protein [Gemmatales bacterium]|nr:SRPBCC family protein [Gemmatales bacterium]MDW8221487.1 SRPBCC family protein [Gemmatales bacterium]
MHVYKLEKQQFVAQPIELVFSFFSDPYNLDKITPDWLRFRTVEVPREVYRGCVFVHRLRIRGVPLTWVSQILEWDPPKRFVDMQVIGPYKLWHHVHEFEAADGGTYIRDLVHYALPLGWLGRLAHALLVRRDLERIFEYRRERLAELLAPLPSPGEIRQPGLAG